MLQDGEEPEYSLISGGLVSGRQTSQEAEGNKRYFLLKYVQCRQLISMICMYVHVGGSSSAVVQRSKMEVALKNSAGILYSLYELKSCHRFLLTHPNKCALKILPHGK